MKRRVFTILSFVSLVLCVALVWMWVRSFDNEFRYRFGTSSERRTIKTSRGQWVLMEAPPDGPDDDAARALAAQMSNDEFHWKSPSEPAGSFYAEGSVRKGGATWTIYERYRDRLRDDSRVRPPLRVWLETMEDPGKRMPAMALLSIPAGWWRAVRVSDEGLENVYLPTYLVYGAGHEDYVAQFRDRWHDAMDEPRVVVFFGWPVLLTMILPMAWMARPRWHRAPTSGRWIFNMAAAASLMVFGFCVRGWIRSYPGEQWAFTSRRIPQPSVPLTATGAGPSDLWFVDWHLGSTHGHLQLLRVERSQNYSSNQKPPFWGFARNWTLLQFNIGSRSGEKRLNFPGLKVYSNPPQVYVPPAPPTLPNPQPVTIYTYITANGAAGSGTNVPPGARIVGIRLQTLPPVVPMPTNVDGVRSFIVDWWLLALCAMILPAIWLREPWTRFRNRGRNLCVNCSYELTGNTTGVCPECGTAFHRAPAENILQ